MVATERKHGNIIFFLLKKLNNHTFSVNTTPHHSIKAKTVISCSQNLNFSNFLSMTHAYFSVACLALTSEKCRRVNCPSSKICCLWIKIFAKSRIQLMQLWICSILDTPNMYSVVVKFSKEMCNW